MQNNETTQNMPNSPHIASPRAPKVNWHIIEQVGLIGTGGGGGGGGGGGSE